MFTGKKHKCLLALTAVLGVVYAQVTSSWPHDYPGKPTGDFSPEWQSYFQVNQSLPNATFPVQRSWAGNIAVNRPGHVNDTLFFWAWEKENGSLTADSDAPWGIWLNGGPGSSSMVGLFFENGPLHIANDYSLYSNNFSWSNVADFVWIDQPVGTGFATADETGFIADEDQMGEDFMGFLSNLVKIFPSLKTRPLHIVGESYAGKYIPYITKAYFGLEDPPVNLAGIAIGDGTIGSETVYNELPTLTVIETYPQLIGYDTDVYEYFKEQSHLCGYDINFTYPQNGYFPTLDPPFRDSNGGASARMQFKQIKNRLLTRLAKQDAPQKRSSVPEHVLVKQKQLKRDLTGRANGTLDPWYQCQIWEEMLEYALNFSAPWTGHGVETGFDPYNIVDGLDPEPPMDASVFLNNDVVRAALHAPTSKNWTANIEYPFGSSNGTLNEDPSVTPMAFLTELATNATAHSVRIAVYLGNDDSLVGHVGSQVVIQNTTFGGIQGFTRPPATPWYGDDGEFAGIVHQERNWTYVLFKGAGHAAPQQQPGHALTFLREFVFGTNQTGLLTNTSGTLAVVGAENATLANTVLPGQEGIYVGSDTIQSTFTYPAATIAHWSSFIATVTTTRFSTLPAAT